MPESGSSRDMLEQLAEEFVERHRRGERPDLSEYTDRHPQLAAAIRDLFPALVKIETLKPGSDDLTGPFAPHAALAAGTHLERLGEFRILREVGRGGMGIVYEAEQESLGRHVALKVLPSGALLDPKQLGRFEREAKAAARLHHTNIVPVYGVGEADGLHYYVMQFIQGQGLDQILGELRLLRGAGAPTDAVAGKTPLSAATQGLLTGRFDAGQVPSLAGLDSRSEAISSTPKVSLPGELENTALSESGQHYYRGVARVGIQVASALAHAHAQGTLHRDIKPSNLLLDSQGAVWVTDFGLAKADDGGDLTGTGEVVGTLRYIPPERFAGQSDARGDVYALGLTLYELLTLRPAFDDAGRHRLIERVLHEDPPRPRQIDPALPRDLETVVLKATAKDPARRYQSAADLADDLRRFVEDRPIRARRATAREHVWRWCRRNPLVAGLTATVVLLLVGVSGASVVLALNEKQAAQTEKGLREDAEGERGKADRARQDAEAVAKENRALLARQYVASGARLLDEGNYAEALPWFIEALKKDAGNPEREAMHRRRIALVSQLCPRPDHLWFHPGPVAKAVFSPDGQRVVTVSGPDGQRNQTRLWDATTGALIGEPIKHKAGVLHVAFSNDGKRFLTITAVLHPLGLPLEPIENGEVRVWEAATGRALTPPLPHNSHWDPAQFSPDGQRLLTIYGITKDPKTNQLIGGEARVWDIATGQPVTPPMKPEDGMKGAIFSPDGRRVLSADRILRNRNRRARAGHLWDAATGKMLDPQDVSSYQPQAYWAKPYLGFRRLVPFAADGRRVEVGSPHRIWDAAGRDSIAIPNTSGRIIFSPDGRRLLQWLPWARVYDAATGQALTPELQHDKMIDNQFWQRLSSAFWSPDSRQVLTVCNEGVRERAEGRLWDAATGKLRGEFAFDNPVKDLEFGPDGKRLVVVHWSNTARVWDVQNARPLTQPIKHGDRPLGASFSPDGRQLLTWGGDEARVWDSFTGRPVTPLLKHNATITGASFSPDGARVLTASEDGTARVWALTTGKPPGLRLLHKSPPVEAALNADGSRLWTFRGYRGQGIMDRNGELQLWDAGKAKPYDRKLQGSMNARFSPDGRHLATYGNDNALVVGANGGLAVDARNGRLQFWDATNGRPVTPPLPFYRDAWVADISPDGRFVAATVGLKPVGNNRPVGALRVWEFETGKELLLQTGASNPTCGFFSLDGRLLANGTPSAHFFDLRTGASLAPPPSAIRSLSKAIFSPDGRLLLTVELDTTFRLQLRDARTGEPLGEPLPNPSIAGQLLAAEFSKDGTRLLTVTAGLDPFVGSLQNVEARLWDTATRERLPIPGTYAGFSGDTRRVWTRAANEARVWDARTAKPISPPLPHPLPVLHAQLSPDGSTLLTYCDSANREERGVMTAGSRGEVRLWDATTGETLTPALPHAGSNATVALSADGRRFLYGPDGLTLALWDLPGDEQRTQEMLAIAGAALSGRQWREPGGVTVLERTEFQTAWQTARARQPEAFAAPPFDAIAWHRRQADLYEQSHDWHAVHWHLSRLIALVPPEAMLYRRRTRANLELDRFAETVADADKANGLGANAPGPWNNKGFALASLGQWDKAVAAFEKATTFKNDDFTIIYWSNLARARARLGDGAGYHAACEGILSRLVLAKSERHRWYARWACAVAPDGPADFNRLVVEDNRDLSNQVENGLVRAAAAYRAGQWQNAVQLLGNDEPIPSNCLVALRLLIRAMAKAKLGRPETAAADFDQAAALLDQLAADEPRWLHWAKYSRIQLDVMLRSDMETLRKEAAKLIGRPHFREAGITWQHRQWKEAMPHLEALLLANPDAPGLLERRARCLVELGQYAKAAADFSRLTELGSTDWEVFVGLGVTRVLSNDLAGYRRDCARLLDRHEKTNDIDLAVRVAGACKFAPLSPEDTARALKLAEKGVKANDQDVFRVWVLGAMLYRSGRYEESIKWMKVREVSDAKGLIWTWCYLAIAQHRLGRSGEAKTNLEKGRAWIKRSVEGEEIPPGWDAGGASYFLSGVFLREIQLLYREAEEVLKEEPKK